MAVNNKATRLNRAMMFGTLFLGIIVIGVCAGAMYFSFDYQKQKNDASTTGDSIIVHVSDSLLLD